MTATVELDLFSGLPNLVWRLSDTSARQLLKDIEQLHLATKAGLAPFCTMAFAGSLIEHDLELDGISESVIYMTGVGTRAQLQDDELRMGQPEEWHQSQSE